MNNFELHEKAEQMTVSNTAYKLARRVIELEHLINVSRREESLITTLLEADHVLTNEELNKIKAETVRGAIEETCHVSFLDGDLYCDPLELEDYVNKLERGEL